MKTILFVCTGNLFRSVTAHYSFNKLNKNKDFIADSAGTSAKERYADPLVRDDLEADFKRDHLNVDGHVPRKLTKEITEKADLVIAMAKDHQEFIKDEFGADAVLFNKVCYDKDESVMDLCETMPDWQDHLIDAKSFLRKTVDYIDSSMPKFIENMDRFLE